MTARYRCVFFCRFLSGEALGTAFTYGGYLMYSGNAVTFIFEKESHCVPVWCALVKPDSQVVYNG